MIFFKCDLCGNTLSHAELITLKIGQNMRSPIAYDLCGQCAKSVRANIEKIKKQRNGEKGNEKQQ